MPKIADIWKLGALGTPTSPDAPIMSSWAHRLQRSLVALERTLRLLHLRVEQATSLPSEVRRYTTDDFDIASSTTLVGVPKLSFNLDIGTFKFHARLVYGNGPGGAKYTIDGTATYSLSLWHTSNQNDATGAYVEYTRHTSVPDAASNATVIAGVIELQGLLVVASIGTVEVQYAQSASNATASSVLAGSWFEVLPADNPL